MSRSAVETLFTLAFGRRPVVVASAPGRVNLIGEHIDYNGGAVLPIAIGQRTWVAMGRATGGASRAVSRDRGEVGGWKDGETSASGVWWDYVAGALESADALGARRKGRDVAVLSDVPMGAGLSSSAALEVATITAALALDGFTLVRTRAPNHDAPPMRREQTFQDVALAAHRAETQYVGVSCGIMDQSASALCQAGHALHLHCDTGVSTAVPFNRSVLIVDTMTPRELRASAYNTRRAECDAALCILREHDPSLSALAHATTALLERARLPAPLDRRARHVVSESRRVADFVRASEAGQDAGEMGRLLTLSHRSMRDDYECSSPELDWVVERSEGRAGIDGARLTGAGWGGCAIVIGDERALRDFAVDVVAAFEGRWGRAARTWLTSPHDGARVEIS